MARTYEVVVQAHKNLIALRRVGRRWQWWGGRRWQTGYRTNNAMLAWLRQTSALRI